MVEHTYGEAVITKEATETEAGVKTKTCAACGDKVEEEIPALGTSTNSDTASKPTDSTTNNELDDDSNDGGSNMVWIIVVIAAAVIGGAIVVIVVKKKK